MNDLSHRLALAALVFCGLLTVSLPWVTTDSAAQPLVLHRQFMVALLGLGLVIAAFVPSVRPPAIAAAVLSKGAYVVLALAGGQAQTAGGASVATEALMCLALVAAAAILVRTAWQEARWDGMLPLHRRA